MRVDIQIEEMQPQDYAIVAALYRDTLFEQQDARFKATYITGAHLRDMTQEGVMILVAKQSRRIIGAIGLAAPSSRFNYSAVAGQMQGMLLGVAKSARKQGVASALIQEALYFAQTSGYESASAAVLKDNKKMQDLISKLPNIEFRRETSSKAGEPVTLLSLPTKAPGRPAEQRMTEHDCQEGN